MKNTSWEFINLSTMQLLKKKKYIFLIKYTLVNEIPYYILLLNIVYYIITHSFNATVD